MTAVYVIAAETGPVKIGIAVDPRQRLRQLVTGAPFKLELAFSAEAGASARKVERKAHESLAANAVHGEWFSVTAAEAIKAVQDAIAAEVGSSDQAPVAAQPIAWSLPTIHGELIRAARCLAGLEQMAVAKLASVSVPTLRKLESAEQVSVSRAPMLAVIAALETAGVEFVPQNEMNGAGVRFRGGPGVRFSNRKQQ